MLTRALAVSAVNLLRNGTPAGERTFATTAWSDLTRQADAWFSNLLRHLLSARVAIATTTKKPSESAGSISIDLDIAVSSLSSEKLFQFFPGAKETVDLVVEDWIEAQHLMLLRLKRDWQQLKSIVAGEVGARVKHISPGLSDPHNGGQTVTILQFANGTRVVYKPRSCEGEQVWFSALQWLNDNGFESWFYIPRLIPRGNYSWMSFVGHRACSSPEAARRFYFRWGAQAAVAQLLGCADLHRQNWIAMGEQPVLIDADMLGDVFSKHAPADPLRRLHPLLQTGFIPILPSDGAGRYDAIAPFDSVSLRKESNVFWPAFKGREQRPDKYVDQIVAGFVSAARFICGPGNRERFERFIARASRRKHLRVLKRATLEYRQILEESLHSRYLQKRGERLKYLLNRCGRDRSGKAEAVCLLRCSVPRFTSKTAPSGQRKTVPPLTVMLASAKLLRSRLKVSKA